MNKKSQVKRLAVTDPHGTYLKLEKAVDAIRFAIDEIDKGNNPRGFLVDTLTEIEPAK